jgi:hypothetical protein
MTWQLVEAEAHGPGGADGGAGVQHAAFCSAVLSSWALAVVHDGSICQGGMQATTLQTIRPMQLTS